MHPWLKGIQICSNEGPCPFPRGDNYEIEDGSISNKYGAKHPWMEGIQICSNEEPFNSNK